MGEWGNLSRGLTFCRSSLISAYSRQNNNKYAVCGRAFAGNFVNAILCVIMVMVMMFVGDDDGRVAVAHIYRVKVSHVCLSLAICRVVLSPNHPATSEVTEGVREKDKGSEE